MNSAEGPAPADAGNVCDTISPSNIAAHNEDQTTLLQETSAHDIMHEVGTASRTTHMLLEADSKRLLKIKQRSQYLAQHVEAGHINEECLNRFFVMQ